MTLRQFVGVFSAIEPIINMESGGKQKPTYIEGKAAVAYFDKLAAKNRAARKKS